LRHLLAILLAILFVLPCFSVCPNAGDPDPGAYASGAAAGHPAPQGQNTAGGEQGRNQVNITSGAEYRRRRRLQQTGA